MGSLLSGDGCYNCPQIRPPPLKASPTACERSSGNSHLNRLPVSVTLEATVFFCARQHSASSTGGSHGDKMSSARSARYAIMDKCGLIFMHFSGIFLCQLPVLRQTGFAHGPVCQKHNKHSLCLKQRNIRRLCNSPRKRNSEEQETVFFTIKSTMSAAWPEPCCLQSAVHVSTYPTPVINVR